jgi:hypothetical protein
MAVRLRGLPTPPAPKSGSACNSLRSNSRRFLSDFGTGDVAPSTGIHVKSSVNGNGNGQRNCNGRCAGKSNSNGLCAANCHRGAYSHVYRAGRHFCTAPQSQGR